MPEIPKKPWSEHSHNTPIVESKEDRFIARSQHLRASNRAKFAQLLRERLSSDPELAAFLRMHRFITPSMDGTILHGTDEPIMKRTLSSEDVTGKPHAPRLEAADKLSAVFRLK